MYICLLVFGPLTAVIAGVINFISLLVFFPGQLITGPIYNLIAIFASYLGIIVIKRRKKFVLDRNNVTKDILSADMLLIIALPVSYTHLTLPTKA